MVAGAGGTVAGGLVSGGTDAADGPAAGACTRNWAHTTDDCCETHTVWAPGVAERGMVTCPDAEPVASVAAVAMDWFGASNEMMSWLDGANWLASTVTREPLGPAAGSMT